MARRKKQQSALGVIFGILGLALAVLCLFAPNTYNSLSRTIGNAYTSIMLK